MSKKYKDDGQSASNDILLNFVDTDDYDDTNELAIKVIDENYTKELTDIFDSLKKDEAVKDEKVKRESLNEAKERLLLDSEVIHAFTNNMKEDQKLKKIYASILLVIFIIQIIAFNAFLVFIGLGTLNYDNSTLNNYIIGAILEIIFLIKIIVSYLFKDNITIPLSNVLEKNKTNK